MGSISAIKDLLECPVCMTFMYGRIHQCCNGHSICSTCKVKVNDICPLCRVELGNIRALGLEKIAELLELPCKFHAFGCQVNSSHHTRLLHERFCCFGPYNCPYNTDLCLVTGDIRSLVVHLKESHRASVIDGSSFKITFVISNLDEMDNWVCQFKIINCFSHQFCLQLEASKVGNEPVFMAYLRFMGEVSNANKFKYKLKVAGKESVMSWQGIPRSIRNTDTKIPDKLDGLVIQKNMALFLSDNGELKLDVTGRIWIKEKRIKTGNVIQNRLAMLEIRR